MSIVENETVERDGDDQASAVDVNIDSDDVSAGEITTDIQYQAEDITPEQAHELLRAATALRREDKRAVENYADAMRRGTWLNNGMPIIFDEAGHVIDGFHRLAAVEKSGVTIRTTTARNVAADVVHTIDQHRKRRYSGVLESRGVRNAGTLVRLMGRLIRIENGVFTVNNSHIGWSRLDQVFKANPELGEAMRLGDAEGNSLLRAGVRHILFFMALRAGRTKELGEFLRDFASTADEEHLAFKSTRKFRIELLAHRTRARRGTTGSNAAGLGEDEEIAGAIMAFNDAFGGDKRRDSYIWERDTAKVKIIDDARYEAEQEKAIKRALAAEKRRLKKEGRADEIDNIDVDSLEINFKPPMKEVTPANHGMELMDGYPGIRAGKLTDMAAGNDYESQLESELKDAQAKEHGDPVHKTIVLTPKLARRFMRYNMHNRKIQPNHVSMIASDIKQGYWMVNAQPICFTHNPFADDADERNTRLLNGQHRLEACIEANEPIEITIAWDVPAEAFATYDIHAKRGMMADVKAGDERVLKAAAKFMWRVDSGYDALTPKTPTATELMMALKRHPSLSEVFSDARRLREFGSAGVMTYVLARIQEERPDYFDEYFEIMHTGSPIERGNPLGQMRTEIHGVYNNKAGSKRNEVLKLHLQAWEAYRDWRIEKEMAKGQ